MVNNKNSNSMYDSHTHLCSSILKADEDLVLRRFVKAGGRGLLNVAYDLNTIFTVLEQSEFLRSKYKIDIRSAIGLHPELFYYSSDLENPILTFSETTNAIKLVESHLERHLDDVSAIGETGLDYKRITEDQTLRLSEKEEQIQNQKHSFREHLNLAHKFNLPLTIHLRDTEGSDKVFQDAVEMVSEVGGGHIRGVFHSYTGPVKLLEQITSLGFMVGINGIITYNSGDTVRDIAKELHLSEVLIETDGPYLPPAEKRKLGKKTGIKYSEPADIKEIALKIAEVKGISYERVITETSRNFLSMFGEVRKD